MKHIDLRTKVEQVLLERQKRNPRYSLRSFARDLKINVAALSRFLAGKQKLSDASVQKVLTHIVPEDWPDGKRPSRKLFQFRTLSLDEYLPVSSLLHWTMAYLPFLDTFQPKLAWIAERLGISITSADKTARELFDAGWLIKGPSGEWLTRQGAISSPSEREMSPEWRKKSLQEIQHAEKRAYDFAMQSSENDCAIITLSSEDFEAAVKMASEFRREFIQRFAKAKEPGKSTTGADELYLLHTSLVPLSINPKK